MLSAIISHAPLIASFALSTPFSSEIYASAAFSSGSFVFCNVISAANGSSPFSFAIVARVRRFGRYGRYRSSTATSVSAARICFFNSSVSFPCSSILEITCSFFSSRFLKYTRRSYSFLSCSSFSSPVASFLYLEINGIVFPSSISCTAASICQRFTSSSSVSL